MVLTLWQALPSNGRITDHLSTSQETLMEIGTLLPMVINKLSPTPFPQPGSGHVSSPGTGDNVIFPPRPKRTMRKKDRKGTPPKVVLSPRVETRNRGERRRHPPYLSGVCLGIITLKTVFSIHQDSRVPLPLLLRHLILSYTHCVFYSSTYLHAVSTRF